VKQILMKLELGDRVQAVIVADETGVNRPRSRRQANARRARACPARAGARGEAGLFR
jgi:hypothetical protein